MKKTLFFLLPMTFLMISCKEETSKSTPSILEAASPEVYVSSYPLYFFTERIGGEQVDLHFPMKDSRNQANWKPVADTIAAMQTADLIFINGADFEKWLMNTSLPSNAIINTSDAYSDQLLSGGKTYTHSHGAEGAHEHTAKARTTWLDLDLAMKQAQTITENLKRIAPEHSNYYDDNLKALNSELEGLHRQFEAVTSTNPEIAVAFSHPEYQYFQKAYNIKGESLHWEPSQKLTSDMLHDVKHLKDKTNLKFIIWEAPPLNESKVALENVGVQSVVISPILGTPEQGNFLDQIRVNLENLKTVYSD